MKTLCTLNCVVCGSESVVYKGGYVILKTENGGAKILALQCEFHKCDDTSHYYGLWESYMGLSESYIELSVKKASLKRDAIKAEVEKRKLLNQKNWRVGYRNDTNSQFRYLNWQFNGYGEYCLEECCDYTYYVVFDNVKDEIFISNDSRHPKMQVKPVTFIKWTRVM